MGALKEIINDRKIIWKLAINDFKSRYAGSFLGVIWAFVQPVVTVIIYAFIFGAGLKTLPTGDDYPFLLYLIAGIIPYFYVNDAINSATNSIIEYSYIIKKMVFDIKLLPIIKVVTSFFVHLFFIVLSLIIFMLHGKIMNVYFIQIVYYCFCATVLSLGITYLTSAINVFFRDMSQIVSIIMQFMMWLTPIMYDLSMFPEWIGRILKFNPLYYIVNGYRDCFINNICFFEHVGQTIYFWIVTLIILIIGVTVFKKLKDAFADVL